MKYLKWYAAAFLVVIALSVFGIFTSVVSAPGRVIDKTLQTDNIITSYEWFYDVNAQVESRAGQIRSHRDLIKDESDAKEKTRLNIELSAMRQSCRDMATKYNANSEKANKTLFKSKSLPETISTSTCEA